MDRKYKINTFALVKNLKTMRRIHMLTSNLLLTLGMGLLQVGCAQSTADRSTDVNGHHFVDLQLPSGLLWADTNIGAESPTDCGQQFAWGETKVKADYSQATYRYGTDFEKMTRYCDADHKKTLSAEDDVATALWGKECRMPTQEELEELGDTANCQWEWTEQVSAKGDTIRGYEVRSVRNGNTIFFPATGAHNGKNYYNDGTNGVYWTSSLAPRSNGEAFCLYFNLGHYSYYMNDRSIGASVRGVLKLRVKS